MILSWSNKQSFGQWKKNTLYFAFTDLLNNNIENLGNFGLLYLRVEQVYISCTVYMYSNTFHNLFTRLNFNSRRKKGSPSVQLSEGGKVHRLSGFLESQATILTLHRNNNKDLNSFGIFKQKWLFKKKEGGDSCFFLLSIILPTFLSVWFPLVS